MSTQEGFEDIINSKFAEKEFSFDEENWKAAEEMISSHRKKEEINTQEGFENIINSKFEDQEFSFDEESWEAAEQMISTQRRKEKRKKGALILFSGLVLGIAVMLPFVLNKNKEAHSPQQLSEVKENVVETSTNTKTQSSSVNSPKTIKQYSTLKEEHVKGKSTAITSVTTKNKPAENSFSTSTNNTYEEVEPGSEKVVSTEKRSTLNKNGKSKSSKNNLIDSEKNKTIAPPTITTELIANKEKEAILKIEAQNNVAQKIKMDSLITKVDSIKTTDSASVSKKAEKQPSDFIDKSIKVYALAGGNYVNNFSFNPIEGLEFSKPINSHFSIGTGLSYTYLTIKSGAVKTIITNTSYDFGYTSEAIDIKTNKLHYLVIPVFVHYHLNNKNTIMLGANNYMLFTVSNTYSTYNDVNGTKTDIASKKTYGYASGINPYDVGIMAGYRRNIFGNFGISVYFNYGLMDIKKNDYYKEHYFDRNVSGQLMLTYKLR